MKDLPPPKKTIAQALGSPKCRTTYMTEETEGDWGEEVPMLARQDVHGSSGVPRDHGAD